MSCDCSGKILFSDYDRTFKYKSQNAIEKNVEAIKCFTENGGQFAFATGRGEDNFSELLPYYREIVNAPMIFYNGGYIIDCKRNRVLNYSSYDSAFTCKVLRDIKNKYPQILINVHGGSRTLYYDTDLNNINEDKWIKFTLNGEHSLLERISEEIPDNIYNIQFSVYSSDTCLEYLPKSISKSKAVKIIREYYRNDLNEPCKIYAIGDYDNDYDMLKSADVSATPQNGTDKLKEIADVTVCHCDEGAVAEFIKMIMAGEI